MSSVASWMVAPDDPVIVNPDPDWVKTAGLSNTVGLTVNGTIVATIPVAGNAGIEDLNRALGRVSTAAANAVWDNLYPGWNGASFG